jgi:hypothetical protein
VLAHLLAGTGWWIDALVDCILRLVEQEIHTHTTSMIFDLTILLVKLYT